jgi:hypothetical protein
MATAILLLFGFCCLGIGILIGFHFGICANEDTEDDGPDPYNILSGDDL